ncbi:MAG TPA: alpha/beta hydrolase [Alcanivoracaceae bacterium]|nr:alpha/beta hydrolase [Alcanivoracaceae bacterium]
MLDKPTLVFSHANGFPGGSYKTFLAPFEEHYHVHAIDKLGHSPKFPVNKGWTNLIDELEQELAPLPKPFVGMGHSLGGVVMFGLARRKPEWFDKVVMLDPPLVNGWLSIPMRIGMAIGLSDKLTPAGLSKTRRIHWENWEQVEGYFSRRRFFQLFDPRCLQDYLAAGLEEAEDGGYQLRFLREVEVEIFRSGPPSVMGRPRLQVPGLLVSGANSEDLFHKASARHCKYHKMAHLFAPGTHMFPLENPAEAYGMIIKWLQQ